MLNSTEHEVQLLIKTKIPTNEEVFFALRPSDVVSIMLIDVKMPITVDVLKLHSL